MSTSASQDSSCTKKTESRKWILSNPVIDNPIYDFFEDPFPHSALPIFDTEDHTYTYLVDASILSTKPMFSTLPNADELSQNNDKKDDLDDVAAAPSLLEAVNVELSQNNDKIVMSQNDKTESPTKLDLNAELSENNDKSKKDLDVAAAPPLTEGSTGANAAGLSKSEIPSKKDLDAATVPPPTTATPPKEVIHHVATQHVIVVETGEDVAEKIISLAKDGPKSVSILSATGKIAKVIITRRATEIETHEGLYNIVSLSGSFMSDEVEGQLRVTGGLYISLATDYGIISFKGRVAGELIAASPVEVTVRIVTSESEKESLEVIHHVKEER